MSSLFIRLLLSVIYSTLMLLSLETPKTINFPFVPNEKLLVLGVTILNHIMVVAWEITIYKLHVYLQWFIRPLLFVIFYSTLMWVSLGTLKPINFPFVPYGKLMVIGVTIFNHIVVAWENNYTNYTYNDETTMMTISCPSGTSVLIYSSISRSITNGIWCLEHLHWGLS